MANSEPGVRRGPPLFRTLHEDVQHIWADFKRYGFKRTIHRTYLELHDFYLDAQAKEQLRGMGKFRRTINLAFWLLTSLFLKLKRPISSIKDRRPPSVFIFRCSASQRWSSS